MVYDQELHKICQGERQSAEDRDPDFLPDRFEDVLEFYFTQRETADDGDACLGAGISSCIHQHRNVRCKNDIGGKGIRVFRDDRAGEGRGDHEEKQPGHPFSVRLEDTDTEVRLVGRDDSSHLFDILRRLFFEDIDDVIDGDDSDETVLVVDNRHGGEVVLLEHIRRLFLVGKGIDADDVVVHDLADDVCLLLEEKIADRDGADQQALLVKDIADIDGLGVESETLDPLDRILDGHGLDEVDVLDRHDASRGILRIAEEVVDVRAGIRAGVCQNFLYDVGRHLLEKVGRVVSHHVIDDVRSFLIGKGLDDVLLAFNFKI